MLKRIKYLDTILFILALLLEERICRYYLGGSLFFWQELLLNFLSLLPFIAILLLLKGKLRLIVERILLIVFSIYQFAQAYHYNFFSTVFSFRKLSLGNELFKVLPEVASKFSLGYLLFLVPIILFFPLAKKGDNFKLKILIPVSIVLVLVSFLSLRQYRLFLWDDYKEEKRWAHDFYLYEVMQNRNRYYLRFGSLRYIVKDLKLTFKDSKGEMDEEKEKELTAFNEKYSSVSTNDMTDLFEGKNLIFILAESLDDSVIDEEMTPTLYKMKNDGYYFNNYYAPIYEVATGDNEFISQTGILPSIDYGTTAYTFHLNDYPNSLANLFNEKAYTCQSFHSYIANFYNRELMHTSFGFETFWDMDKLGLERWEGYKDTINWQKDEDLFKGMLEHTDFSSPFYNFVITASGHMYYTRSRVELEENYALIDNNERFDEYSNESKGYLASQMLLDQGLEVLLEGLEENGVLEDTIIIIFGDHYPYGIKTEEAMQQYWGEGVDIYKVPLIIYGEGLSGEDDSLVSTVDLYPTICNLFGLDNSEYYKAGHDIFDHDNYDYVFFANHSILSNDFYYDGESDELTYFEEDNGKYEEIIEEVLELLNLGQEILYYNYFEVLD